MREIIERITEMCPVCKGVGSVVPTTSGCHSRLCWRCDHRGWITLKERDITDQVDAILTAAQKILERYE